MLDVSPFIAYNLLIGVLTGVGLLYFLVLEPVVVEYHRFLLVTLSGLLLFLIGGPLAELFVPALVHWVHGISSILVVFGLYNPVRNDLRREAWADVFLREPTRIRRSVDWMLPVDDAILGIFHSSDLVLTPAIIAYNIDYSREEVNRRLTEMESHGFVERVERGKYRITRLGEQYLRGPVTRSVLHRLRFRFGFD